MKKLALVITGLLIGCMLAAAGIELWCRLAGRCGLHCSGDDRGLNCNAARFRPSRNILLGWEFDPAYRGGNDAGCQINSHGNYDKEYCLKRAADTYRILVLGDSITEQGWYVKKLGELLAEALPGKEIEVWNCGAGGYSIAQYYYYLKEKGFGYDPDMVIIGFCLNDFSDTPVVLRKADGTFFCCDNPFGGGVMGRQVLPINRSLFLHSYAYRFFVLTAERFLNPCRDDQQRWDAIAPTKAAWLLDRIAAETRERNIAFYAAIIPYLKTSYDPLEKSQYASIRSSLERHSVSFIDLHGTFTVIDDPSWRKHPDDFVHPSEKGHAVIAKGIFDYLMKDRKNWYERKNPAHR